MATTSAQRAAPSYGAQYRHHPYAAGPSRQPAPSPAAPSAPKWHAANAPSSSTQRLLTSEMPPSPPRSRREHSETPSIGLSVAFGGARGGKWWDEELPPPPSSLGSILESFKRSGEGDRELLLSILGAKKAEEERLTALIQTRLTILQARLSIHSAAAQLGPAPLTPASDAPASVDKLAPPERTPSLSSSRGSLGSTNGPISPSYMPPPPPPAQLASEKAAGTSDRHSYFHLPPPQSMLRRRSRSRSPPQHAQHSDRYAPVRIGDRDIMARQPSARGSTSPRSNGSDGRAPGLDMLLDAGMERERRDSGGRD